MLESQTSSGDTIREIPDVSKLFKTPKMVPPKTPMTAPEPTPADEKREAMTNERDMARRYGGKGRASTVLTGQGASGTLG